MSSENTLYDNHGRPITYLRLAVTDRCNLRCLYCMPQGITYLPRKELLNFEEIERLVGLTTSMGITKVRLTGGEPFLRTDLMKLIRRLVALPGLRDLHITTNGVLTYEHIPELKELGIASVNLSLDTLDREKFRKITLRDEFQNVLRTLERLLEYKLRVKINVVVMDGKNTDDIIPMVEYTREHPVSVRFIEEMPFNGEGSHYAKLNWTYRRIMQHISDHYPTLKKLPEEANGTAALYRVPGFAGDIGIIAAFSRTFCGTCNRIRVTAQGVLKTCLYDDGVLNIKNLIRSGMNDDSIRKALATAFQHRATNGFEAEAMRKSHQPLESMSTIGG